MIICDESTTEISFVILFGCSRFCEYNRLYFKLMYLVLERVCKWEHIFVGIDSGTKRRKKREISPLFKQLKFYSFKLYYFSP